MHDDHDVRAASRRSHDTDDDHALADVTLALASPGDGALTLEVSPTEITILVGQQRLVVTGRDLSLHIDRRDLDTVHPPPSSAPVVPMPTPDAAELAVLERFHGRLRLSETGCWEWTGSHNRASVSMGVDG